MLTLLMVIAIAGCGSKKRQPIVLTLSTEDSEAILKAAGITLPAIEDAAGAKTTVKWFGWSDPFQNYTESEIVNTGFWTFKNKYECDIDVVETTYSGHTDDLAMLITAGTPPDLMPGGTNATAVYPMFAIKSMIQPVDPWIDYSDPLWAPMAELAENFALGDKHYQICIQTKPSNVVVYNRRVMSEWGFDDPAELYWNDDWTWAKFYDMCLEFSDADDDRFALDGYAYVGMFYESAGQQLLMLDPAKGYWSNVDSPEIERGMGYLYELKKNECTYHQGSNRWALRDSGTFGAGLNTGKCLFYVIGESFFTAPVEEISAVWGDMEAQEVMFAPLPRDERGDGVYYCASSFDDVKGAMAIISGARNPEGAALLAACIRFKVIDPTVINIDKRQLMTTYLWTEEMVEMSEECARIAAANFVIDPTGNLPDNLQNPIRSLMGDGIIRSNDDNSWAQIKERYSEQAQYYIDELNETIKSYSQS